MDKKNRFLLGMSVLSSFIIYVIALLGFILWVISSTSPNKIILSFVLGSLFVAGFYSFYRLFRIWLYNK